MVEAARPSCRAIARKLSPSPLSAASRSLSSSLRCVPPDIAPSRFAIPGQNLTTRPQDVALHARLRQLALGTADLGLVAGDLRFALPDALAQDRLLVGQRPCPAGE